MGDELRLRDLSGSLPIREWGPLTWAECEDCGSNGPYAATEGDEKVFDGESVVCPDCGAVGHTTVDEGCEGDEDDPGDPAVAHVTWGEDRLRPAALAGLRRLVLVRPHWVAR